MSSTDASVREGTTAPSLTWRSALLPLAVFLVLGAAEALLFDHLLFQRSVHHEFVLTAIEGVLTGRPVSESWQHRIMGPFIVALLGHLTPTRLDALRLFSAMTVIGANLLLMGIVRRKGGSVAHGLTAIVAFGTLHLLLLYRIEYPWDGLDVLGFLFFGYWAYRRGSLGPLGPLLLVGALNHETVLYIPFWYMLGWLDTIGSRPTARASPRWRECLGAAVAALLIAAVVVGLRRWLYIGKPELAGQVFEIATPVIGNHLHVAHNVERFLRADWSAARTWHTAALLFGFAALAALALHRRLYRATMWSACVLLSVFCFGYLDETRHYLSLMAFWFGYGWGPRLDETRTALDSPQLD
jgi:hypothetical protein